MYWETWHLLRCQFNQLKGNNQMTMIAVYPTKKNLKENIGKKLSYIETSLFGNEYKSNGSFVVCNRPHITNIGREWFAQVKMSDDIIIGVK